MNKKAVTAVVLEILAALFFIFYHSPLLLVLFNSGKEYVDIAKDPFSLPKNWGVLLEKIKEFFLRIIQDIVHRFLIQITGVFDLLCCPYQLP